MSQRSQFIIWLLLAATVGVYAVVASWVASEPFPTPPYAVAAFDALTFSLLSVVCMWSMFRPSKTAWSRISPAIAVFVASLLVAAVASSPVSFWDQFIAYFPVFGLHVALLLLALWGLQRTQFWQRRFGNVRAWRFSVAELLVVMTAVAVLTAAMRGSPFLGESGWLIVAVIVCTVTLVVASVVLWSLALHWLICLAGTLGVAALLGGAFGIIAYQGPVFAKIIGADLLIQAAVLSIWLGVGRILPSTTVANVDDVKSPTI